MLLLKYIKMIREVTPGNALINAPVTFSSSLIEMIPIFSLIGIQKNKDLSNVKTCSSI